MINKVLEAIKKYNVVHSKDRIVVGVSGGPDSVCLLHILYQLRESMDLGLVAVHVNHMLRGNESLEDEAFVENLCVKLNVELITRRIDIKKLAKERKLSLEEAGRIERYRLFDEVADSHNAQRIAVAHNKNDQAETVLMNIIRGAGLDGLRGMDYIRGRIIRPLLGIERWEIEDYCRSNSLNPRIDSSNLEDIYTRNRVRLDLIPYIDKLFNADIVNGISKMADLIRDDGNFIDKQIDVIFNKALVKSDDGEILLDLSVLKECHIAAQRRVLRNSIKKVKGNIKGIAIIHIDSIIDLIENGATGSMLHLPDGVRAVKSYETLKIYLNGCEEEDLSFDKELNIPGATIINEINGKMEAYVIDVSTNAFNIKDFTNIPDKSGVQFFDYDKLKEGIYLRNRRDGDVFKPLKSNGTKKLKKFFVDNKIPRESRNRIPLISKDKEIVWIIGFKISDKFKVTENTKTILKLSYDKSH
ncbi:tRNA lysidine(34) synthetase TilS [Acetivibrio mesophilus]|uniref:tRNA(Ile)-lysidine synthase n=1 Tax=Acetivibrio mesophilus TaxID=2487273 RepID=A0A4Q0I3R6_9FIRM|nr:tRNA lysidine(34) synthetase TilS [Acetivibrio mesophilus]RXE58851.1 tRNA lysidine(34) synthetase TilS [Acetivibrio mesophilus]HHV29553.1 tRNA lysidine(34) synthetase TilS [Clostridium sp.]